MTSSLSPSAIGILSYNAGNVGSIGRALTRLGISWTRVEKSEDFARVSGLIFPGAGAAGSAIRDLCSRGLDEKIRSFRKPFLGLCLGMQLLLESSEEDDTKCLGIIRGTVRSLPDTIVKPHMGWNRLSTGAFAYFVHSFVCEPVDPCATTMTVQYGSTICAGMRQGNFFGVQWHPEKSGRTGDLYLQAFSSLCK